MTQERDLQLILAALRPLPDPFNIGLIVAEQYRNRFGRYPDPLHPKTFNEKIQSRKLFDRRPILATMTDKYAVRDYVAARVGDAVLPVLYHVTENPSDLPFSSLPDRYVVKATHGSGWVHLVKSREVRDEPAIVKLCESWLSQNFYEMTCEWAYKNIPRRIIVEEFLDNGADESAEDFKLFTFNGRVEFIQVDLDRFSNHKKTFFDRDWNRVDLRQECDNFPGPIAKPRSLGALIACAEALAQGIDFVRVDLYIVKDKIYFGELTTTPGNGFFRFDPPAFDEHFGNLWKMEISSLAPLFGGAVEPA
jgi:TupA-like ATPgrasp